MLPEGRTWLRFVVARGTSVGSSPVGRMWLRLVVARGMGVGSLREGRGERVHISRVYRACVVVAEVSRAGGWVREERQRVDAP